MIVRIISTMSLQRTSYKHMIIICTKLRFGNNGFVGAYLTISLVLIWYFWDVLLSCSLLAPRAIDGYDYRNDHLVQRRVS